MDSSKGSHSPAWGPKKSWAVPSTLSSPATASASRDPTPSSSSAFPPLSSPQARRPPSRTVSSFSSVDSSLIASSSFNPYPTRRQELAQRAASHGTRKRSHITRSDPSTSRIHSLLDYEDDDAIMHDLRDEEDEEGEVSSRGATMSSIVFRDLTASAATSRSASPWQQGGLSPGLAMFATTTFGGEPLRVLANVDEELGAAHMGPRIYRRHNQKHVRNKVRAKIDAVHTVSPMADSRTEVDGEKGRTIGAETAQGADMTEEEKKRLKSLDLQKLVDECRRCHNVVAVQNRAGSGDKTSSNVDESQSLQTLLSAVRVRTADPQTWATSDSHPIISDDLLPVGLSKQQRIDFTILPSTSLVQVQSAVLQGLNLLLDSMLESTRQDVVVTLSHLLSLQPLRPTATTNVDLKSELRRTFLHLLDTFHRFPNIAPAELLTSVLARMHTSPDPLVDLVGELVGLCGQQMASNPTVLTETQDSTLVCAASFLSLCLSVNSSRPAATRLHVHAIYCTVLDLAPFLEHFVHHAASIVRANAAAVGMAKFNICKWPFLLSLGAKVRILQLENEVRLARAPPRDSAAGGQRFALPAAEGATRAELVVLPTSLNLKIDRAQAWDQSRGLLLQLLETSPAVQRGLRVEFTGEQAADGGGPTREWFATVASTWSDVRNVIGTHGWFIASDDANHDNANHDTAAFLGLLLALAVLHTTKLALPFPLPAVAFKIATAPRMDELVLTPTDLEFADAPLAKSLQSVLDWSPAADEEFESTFALTWSTTIRTASGEIQTLDLVPGGRHRGVKLEERREFVSKLIWRVLVGSVKDQVSAFRDAWRSVVPGCGAKGAETATEVIGRGGLALSLFSAEEVAQAILSVPSSSSGSSTTPLDVDDIKSSTELVVPSNVERGDVVEWFWTAWAELDAAQQRRLLAFITGAEDLPATGARGIGLRIHLVATWLDKDARAWPLPWSSTCTSTLFLPTYPTQQLLRAKVQVAIEHYQGFGLR